MFGYSLPLLFGRLFGVGLFVAGIVFLNHYWREGDHPKLAARKALKSKWVWFFMILAWIAFVVEIVYLHNQ